MQNGDLIQINNVENIRSDVKKIIDLGEILIPFGEFIENNSLLPDSSYVYEWWVQELQHALGCLPKTNTIDDISKADLALQQRINEEFQRPIDVKRPTSYDAFAVAEKFTIPLHPDYNLFWHDLSVENVRQLATYIKDQGKVIVEENTVLTLPSNSEIKEILIELGALHKQPRARTSGPAIAAGLAVLVSDLCGCAPDLVREGVNGFQFPCGDVAVLRERMRWLVDHPESVRSFGVASRRISERYSLAAAAEGFERAARVTGPRKAVLENR